MNDSGCHQIVDNHFMSIEKVLLLALISSNIERQSDVVINLSDII